MKKQRRAILVFLFLSLLAVGGLFLGALSSKTALAIASDRYEQLQTFSKVLNLIQN